MVNVTDGGDALRHDDVEPLILAIGEGRTVTTVDALSDMPLQTFAPFAVTLTVAVPEKPGFHVTIAVAPVPEIVLPAPVTVQL